MAKMRVVQVPRAGGPLELVERDIPEPQPGWVRVKCSVALLTTGISFDGGYAEYTVAPGEALARVPEELSGVDAAPLMCAGVTTFNALRNSGARGGDVVAVLGIGGLGHLGVQFAAKMGFNTVAIARGKEKGAFARQLGAHHYAIRRSDSAH